MLMEIKDNNYLYNYKELNADHDLKWYDYGARFYDAVIGRWHVVDPMGEIASSWSPYNYVENNALVKHDPSGMYSESMNNFDLATGAAKRVFGADMELEIGEKGTYVEVTEEYKVDKELKGAGINPNDKADFSSRSIETVEKLPSIAKLLPQGKSKLKEVRLDGNADESAKSFYKEGIITMNVKDFSSWRLLATAYGHEHVHRIVTGDYSQELLDAGFGINKDGSWSFPYFYNELLAHTWSFNYSGFPEPNSRGLNAIKNFEEKSKRYNRRGVNIVTQFYEKHKILP